VLSGVTVTGFSNCGAVVRNFEQDFSGIYDSGVVSTHFLYYTSRAEMSLEYAYIEGDDFREAKY